MSENRVRLNVGGTVFETYVSTLTRNVDSYFSVAFSDRWVSDSVELFIDRDPTHFRFVLNFLRNYDEKNKKSVPLPDELCALEELREEAEFYSIKELEKIVIEKLATLKREHDLLLQSLVQIKTQMDNIMGSLDEIYFNLFQKSEGNKLPRR